jgi:hypothetical protein
LFSEVLVLLVRLALEVLDGVEAKDVKDALSALSLGIVRKEAIRSPMTTNEVFQGGRHLGFVMHRIDNSFRTVLANIGLCHGTTAMAESAIVMSRSIAKEGVRSNTFIPAINIAGGKAGTEMLAEGKTFQSTSKLGSCFDGLLDTISRNPSKVGTKELQVGSSSREITLVDAKILKQARNGSAHGVNGNLLTTLIDNDINVIREVANIVSKISSPRIKVQSMKVERCIKGKVSRREFVVHRGRVPDSIRGQDDMREGSIFIIRRRAHVNIRKARTI